MNKHCYRLIFSRTHGELRVVSELARSCSSEPGQTVAAGHRACGSRCAGQYGCSDCRCLPSGAGRRDCSRWTGNAGQRPEVIATQNGLPQVNITAPNQAGVSHNQYSQFDVARTALS